MGFLDSLAFGSVKGLMEGAGSLAKDIRAAITGEISPEKKAELLQKANELESQGMQAQAEINKMEASHRSMFVAGARPFILWTCGVGIAFHFIVFPLVEWIAVLTGNPIALPKINSGELMTLVLSLLGLGAYRSYEKKHGLTV